MKNITKTFAIAGITALGFLPVKSEGQSISSLRKVNSENFEINLKDNEQHVVKKNKEEGLKEIFQLNKIQKYEEAWLYIPFYEQWHEIGIESEYHTVSFDLPRIRNILDEHKNECGYFFMKKAKEICFVHNHPLTCKSGLSHGDLISLIATTQMFQDYDVRGIAVTNKGAIEYYLNPEKKEKLFLKNKKFLINRKIRKFEKMPYPEISKYFDIRFTKFD